MERARAAGAEVGKKAGQAAYGEYQKEKEAARQDAKEEFRRADLEIVTPIGVIKKKGEEGQGTERGAGGPSGSPGVSEKKPKASGMPEIPGM